MIGMRDVLIHRYFEVDLELTWQVVQRDIPKLKNVILRLMEDLGNSRLKLLLAALSLIFWDDVP
jgi:uncharacterized protein with HEPN domain